MVKEWRKGSLDLKFGFHGFWFKISLIEKREARWT